MQDSDTSTSHIHLRAVETSVICVSQLWFYLLNYKILFFPLDLVVCQSCAVKIFIRDLCSEMGQTLANSNEFYIMLYKIKYYHNNNSFMPKLLVSLYNFFSFLCILNDLFLPLLHQEKFLL